MLVTYLYIPYLCKLISYFHSLAFAIMFYCCQNPKIIRKEINKSNEVIKKKNNFKYLFFKQKLKLNYIFYLKIYINKFFKYTYILF